MHQLNLTFCFINSDYKKIIFSFWLQFKCFLYVCIFTNLNKHRKINGWYWWPTFYIVHYILLSKSYSLFVQNHFQRQRTLIRSVTKLSLWTPLKDRLTLFLEFHQKHGEVCPANWKPGKTTIKPNPEGIKNYLSKNSGEI